MKYGQGLMSVAWKLKCAWYMRVLWPSIWLILEWSRLIDELHNLFWRVKKCNSISRKNSDTENEIGDTKIISLYWVYVCTGTDIAFLTNWRFVATLRRASLSAQFFQQHVLISCLCHILVILALFFLDIMLLHTYRLQYNVNITFICSGKPKICVTRFIGVVWNRTRNISEVCPYLIIQTIVQE